MIGESGQHVYNWQSGSWVQNAGMNTDNFIGAKPPGGPHTIVKLGSTTVASSSDANRASGMPFLVGIDESGNIYLSKP
jgi:hypothetical protein